MTTVTFEIPDNLAQYAEEQGVFTSEWAAGLTRSILDRLCPVRESDNAAAWKEFMAALREIKDEPLGDDMPPRITFRELTL